MNRKSFLKTLGFAAILPQTSFFNLDKLKACQTYQSDWVKTDDFITYWYLLPEGHYYYSDFFAITARDGDIYFTIDKDKQVIVRSKKENVRVSIIYFDRDSMTMTTSIV